MISSHHLIAASRVEGTPVFNTLGDRIGTIDDVMLDKTTGRAVYALMSFDGFLGLGQKFYPLPWSTLTYDEKAEGYAIPLTHEQLKAGHAVSDKEIADEIDWREAVHAYYGAAPYWIGGPLP
jgi:sporulation protein YlmC with PRC-barrel domain